MISKSKISQIRLLHQKKHRLETRQFIVEGEKSVIECLHSDFTTIEVFGSDKWLSANEMLIKKGIIGTPVSQKEMERLSCLNTAPEVLCIARIPQYSPAQFDNNMPLLMLDGINDPGNLGTIIRTADWFGFKQLICSESTVEFTNPKVIQATMGSFCRVKIVYDHLARFIENTQDRPVLGMCMEGKPIQSIHFQHNSTLIIGSESHGISSEIEQLLTTKVHIQAHADSQTESLNASIAAGILMYHFSLQNEQPVSQHHI